MTTPQLKFFTDPCFLRRIGHRLLGQLFSRFTHLLPSKYSLPNPRPENDAYFDSLATLLERRDDLPDSLFQALGAVEALAVPENYPDIPASPHDSPDTIKVSLLEQAIQTWLSSPEKPANSLPLPKADGRGDGELRAQDSALNPQPSTPGTVASSASPSFPSRPSVQEGRDEGELDSTLDPQPSTSGPVAAPASPPFPPLPPVQNPEPDEPAFDRLARLSPVEYDRAREAEAGRLRIRVKTLDAEVLSRRSELAYLDQAKKINLLPIEPWPEPVNGAEVLHLVSERLSLHLVLQPGAPDAIALWDGHAHAFQAFRHSPRLNLYSAKAQCGKTTTYDVLTPMLPRCLRTESLSPPVVFRLVDQYQLVLLLDEIDAYLLQNEELRGLLNAGHKRGALAYRCEGEGNAVRAFNAFAPAALAGIGHLPSTLRDRSIIIHLVQAAEGQIGKPFDSADAEAETILGRKLARWAKDNFAALAACDPKLPPGVFNRVADNWRPLFAVAQLAGGDWPARALDAFAKLTAKPQPAQDLGLILLADVRQLFATSGAERLFSSAIVDALRALPDRPWSGTHNGDKPITEARLARHLAVFAVYPTLFRLGQRRGKGYQIADFPHVPK